MNANRLFLYGVIVAGLASAGCSPGDSSPSSTQGANPASISAVQKQVSPFVPREPLPTESPPSAQLASPTVVTQPGTVGTVAASANGTPGPNTSLTSSSITGTRTGPLPGAARSVQIQ